MTSIKNFRIACLMIFMLASISNCWAGQSIVLSTQSVTNPNVAAQGVNTACRMEWSFTFNNPLAGGHPLTPDACGLDVQILNDGMGTIDVLIYQTHSTGPGYQQCFIQLGALATKVATIRYQHVPSGLGGSDMCQAWDINGTRFWNETRPYTSTSGSLSNGATVAGGGSGQDIDTAYFRLFTTNVSANARPPVTADVGDLLEWKFDGNLNDTNGLYNGTLLGGGSASYVSTPGQTLVVSSIQTANAPVWNTWSSMQVGTTNGLTCANGYSQADASASVSCVWSLLAGSGSFSSTTSSTPNFTPSVFGDYQIQVVSTDAATNNNTLAIHLGAVGYDAHGVISSNSTNTAKIFGPMMAFGQNPWGYEQERHYTAVRLQAAQNDGYSHDWSTPAQGTVSYPFAGKGVSPGISCTTLSSGITATATSIPVSDASCLSLSSLPTWILVGNSLGSQELVRICSTTGTSGAQTLTACYDGRGIADYPFGNLAVIPAQIWAGGTVVGEYRIQGTSTLFATDSQRAVCPAGVPGPPGPVTYSTGTVSFTASSTSLVGHSTVWNTANGVIATYMIRVDATHAGGTPFVWWSQITTVGSTTSITASRPAPADIDAGNFPYKVTSAIYISLNFVAANGAQARMIQNLKGCESETAAFATVAHDIPAYNSTTQTGQNYSYKLGLGAGSAFGPNFYGNGFQERRFYFLSGLQLALDAANGIDEYWPLDPEFCSGYCLFSPLLWGGGAIGAVADLVTNPSTTLTWDLMRGWADSSSGYAAAGCNAADTRDSGYTQGISTLFYLFDTTHQATWDTVMNAWLTRDNLCHQSDNSYANGFLWNSAYPQVTVTNGSAAGAGTAIDPAICDGIGQVTITATNGSAAITTAGVFNALTNAITINGRSFEFQYVDATHGNLSALWPDASTTYTAMMRNDIGGTDLVAMTMGTSADDPDLQYNYSCIYNGPTSITLDRNWLGTSEAKHPYINLISGYGQQPYMLAIKENAQQWATLGHDATITSGFAALRPLAAEWAQANGYDTQTQGVLYGAIYGFCQPSTAAGVFTYRTPKCSYGLDPGSIRASRAIAGETTSILRGYYDSQSGSVPAVTWGDTIYGSIWGYCPYTTPGYYCDSNYVRDETSDASLAAYKWPGFFFGMGMGDQWAALRAGVPAGNGGSTIGGKAVFGGKFSH